MTRCDEPAATWPDHPTGAKLDYAVDFTEHLTRWHQQGIEYGAGVRVRVRGVPGFEFECTSPGQTGKKPFLWPTAIAGTVTDGSVVWTCRAVTTGSLLTTISGVPVWTCSDAGIVISGQSVAGQIASAFLAGGVAGTDYEVIVTATFVNTGTLPKVCILPVRTPERVCCA